MKLKLRANPPCPKSIRTLLKEIANDITLAIDAYGKDVDEWNWMKAISKVRRKWKLKKFEHNGVSLIALRNIDLGVIVKLPYGSHKKAPPYAVPTEFVPLNKPSAWGENYHIFIQPLIDVSEDAAVKAELMIWRDKRFSKFITDLHDGNTGSFRGYAVAHDW
jgi:hypothetical protein